MGSKSDNIAAIVSLGSYISPYRVSVDELGTYNGEIYVSDSDLMFMPLADMDGSLGTYVGVSEKELADFKENIIGLHKSIAVADSHMDTVVLALNAVENLVRISGRSELSKVGFIFGGTENPPDTAKATIPLAVQQLYPEIPRNIDIRQFTNACCVSGDVLLAARDSTLLQPDKTALVLTGEIAKHSALFNNRAYRKLSTAGSGGWAAIVTSVDPDKDDWLIQLPQPGLEGLFSQFGSGFWMPTGSKYPEVNGFLSCLCYDFGVLGAVADHFEKLDAHEGEHKGVEERLAEYDMVVMHTPFLYQVRDALCLLYSCGTKGFDNVMGELEDSIRKEEERLSIPEKRKEKAHQKYILDMISQARTPEAMSEFERVTAPWQGMPLRTGNSYSAAVPLSLIQGLQNIESENMLKLLLVFFGSGHKSIAMSVNVNPNALPYMLQEEERKKVSIQAYLKSLVLDKPPQFEKERKAGYFGVKYGDRGNPSYLKLQ